ncbi:MAG: peptidoglycan editing factor PgeF [Anaerolineales bacterium]|nr:peptidoglycan editing factor PgeF [Anaerolineales bacterium]
MTFFEQDGLRYFRFPWLSAAGAAHAVLTRRGGVSLAPYESLNLGAVIGDDPQAVAENRRRAFALFGRDPGLAPELSQVHSRRILVARLRAAGEPIPQADGMVTDSPKLTLCLRFADCVPILLFDPVRRAGGIAHAGWKGTAARIAESAVEALALHFGSRPEDIRAGIGPSIGPDHYAVGEDVAGAFRSAFGADCECWFSRRGGSLHLDLWQANEFTLRRAGVKHIELAGVCTACHPEDWFSHRAEHGRTGRFGAMMWLE